MSTLPPTSAAGSTWAAYEPSESAPWNLARVVHLHRRAAFAAPWSHLERDLADGPQAAVGRLLRGGATGSTADIESTSFETIARSIGDAAAASGNAERLKAWWLYRMLVSPDPLGERLTLMWHNHFATSNRKVKNLTLMREQNDLLRGHARAPFGEMLSSVVKHPAMLIWLDADSNRAGHPNENLARETMELFTLGVGNYTEHDIREAARALTGWTVAENRFTNVEKKHDAGEKTVLGRTGPLSGDDFLNVLLENPATPRRLAWRLCHTFLGEGVADEQAQSELAEGLRQHGLDVAWAVETILRSQLFFSAGNLRSRVVGPVELVIGTLRALEETDPPPSTLLLAEWVARMGQDLFYPPNVGGWNEGRTWLSSRSVVARANFAEALVEGQLWNPTHVPPLAELSARYLKTDDLQQTACWFAGLLWGDPASPTARALAESAQSAQPARSPAWIVAQLLARPEYQLA